MEQIKWYTISEYVDRDTGEVITKSEAERNYVKIKNTKRNEFKEQIGNDGIIRKTGERIYTWECERNRQTKLGI